jgi:hypothetical protein
MSAGRYSRSCVVVTTGWGGPTTLSGGPPAGGAFEYKERQKRLT